MKSRPTTSLPPTQATIDAAIAREYPAVKVPEDAVRRWVPDAALRWTIPGQLAVVVESDTTAFHSDDGLSFHIRIGDLVLTTSWEGAEAVAFGLLEQMYGQDWARVMMALCARCPAYEDREMNVPDEAIQALWKAAASYAELWPARSTGFDDHIWGVAPPEGVQPVYPELTP